MNKGFTISSPNGGSISCVGNEVIINGATRIKPQSQIARFLHKLANKIG